MTEIKTLIDDFKNYLINQDISENTTKSYIADLNNFVRWYDECYAVEVLVKKITNHHLAQLNGTCDK